MTAVADLDATVDPLRGPYGGLAELPPPVCPAKDYGNGEWTCTIGPAPARCTEHRWDSAPYYQSEASCIVKLGPVVVACTETTSGSQYNGSYDRSCQITRSTKPIVGCSDVRDGSYDYTKITRRCTVGPISYGCEEEYAPWDRPPKHCSVTGVPKP